MLVPDWVLRIGYDPGPSDSGTGEAHNDVRIAGDDPPVVLVVTVTVIIGGARLAADVECGDAAAEALGDQVHVRQASSFDDLQVEISVEVYYVVVWIRACHVCRDNCGGGGGGL